MDRVRAVLQLARIEFPAPLTLWRSFERVPTRVWRQQLNRSATACDPGDHGAVDATFFDREAASSHYVDRSDRRIGTLKTTALVDTDSCYVLNLHCSAHWPHDTQVGRRARSETLRKSRISPATKAMTTNLSGAYFGSKGVRPLIRHRLFAHYVHAHNARLDSDLYEQRWMAETAFSAIKRRYGSAVRPSAWYREFRELVLTTAVYNLEQAIRR